MLRKIKYITMNANHCDYISIIILYYIEYSVMGNYIIMIKSVSDWPFTIISVTHKDEFRKTFKNWVEVEFSCTT